MTVFSFIVSLAGACTLTSGLFRIIDRLEGRK